jgi:hypothetical protein
MNNILISNFLCFFFKVCNPFIILCINYNKIGVVMMFMSREYIYTAHMLLASSWIQYFLSPSHYYSTHLWQVLSPSFWSVVKNSFFNYSLALFSICFFQLCMYVIYYFTAKFIITFSSLPLFCHNLFLMSCSYFFFFLIISSLENIICSLLLSPVIEGQVSHL